MRLSSEWNGAKADELRTKRDQAREERRKLEAGQRAVLSQLADLHDPPALERDFEAISRLWNEYRSYCAPISTLRRREGFYEGRYNALLGLGTKQEQLARARHMRRTEKRRTAE